MKVDILNSRQITVLLTEEDMKDMDINIDSLDYNSSKAATLLWTILSKASAEANIKIEPQGEIYIDIESVDESRCVMTFTLSKNLQNTTSRNKKGFVSPIIFQFQECDHLLSARKALLSSTMSGLKSDLYSKNNQYRLIIYYPFKISEYISTLLQFSTIIKGGVNIAATKEHWLELSKGNAMETLLKVSKIQQ